MEMYAILWKNFKKIKKIPFAILLTNLGKHKEAKLRPISPHRSVLVDDVYRFSITLTILLRP